MPLWPHLKVGQVVKQAADLLPLDPDLSGPDLRLFLPPGTEEIGPITHETSTLRVAPPVFVLTPLNIPIPPKLSLTVILNPRTRMQETLCPLAALLEAPQVALPLQLFLEIKI